MAKDRNVLKTQGGSTLRFECLTNRGDGVIRLTTTSPDGDQSRELLTEEEAFFYAVGILREVSIARGFE